MRRPPPPPLPNIHVLIYGNTHGWVQGTGWGQQGERLADRRLFCEIGRVISPRQIQTPLRFVW